MLYIKKYWSKLSAFSLAEMMVVMLILSIALAAATPIITRRVIANEQQENGGNPVGTIIWYAASTPPDGYIECNGQSTSAYPALAALVGPNVPDLRGEFIRGWDHGKGINTGRIFGSWEDATGIADQVFQTVHLYYDNPDSPSYGTTYYNSSVGYAGNGRYISRFKIRPRNIALLPCIKY